MTSEATLFNIARKAKTPLAVCGIIVIALYLISKAILTTPKLTSDDTLILLSTIMYYLFWLGIAALVASVLCFITVKHYDRSKKVPEVKIKQDIEKTERIRGLVADVMETGDVSVDQKVRDAKEVEAVRIKKLGEK